ncbi:amino acid adenylation domain-containing protein [Streptomyces sp. NPDC088258]|uniref:amino acid adenylation domain-containing protein n=1 Tax=Streptomyces sp. NPDC088258 TaxID=3365849 RepID=UPI003811D4E3
MRRSYDDSAPPAGTLVHHLFEKRAREHPDATAVICGDTSLTYRELDGRATALARILRRTHAVGPESLVMLVMERGPHVVVGMLAVLKAGGAYVPVSPDTPDDRIRLLLGETACRVVLTDRAHHARLTDIVRTGGPGDTAVRAADEPVPAGEPSAADEAVGDEPATADRLAYVIFTSGTSGRPKGVMVEHRSVVNYIRNANVHLGLSAEDTCDYSTSVSFDLTVTTTLAPLALGARVAVYDGPVQDADAYREFLARREVTFVKLTPGYFALIADGLHRTGVRTVVLGGEKLHRTVLERIRTRPGQDLTVYDEYGPTEATVGTCAGPVHPLPAGAVPNIGRLYDGYRGYVLDPEGRPVPDGEAGELFIGGIGLARGYLGRPERTAERFREHLLPAGAGDGASGPVPDGGGPVRLYRTGDLVRRLPGGEFEYIGRNDDQVKIRGYRIEPAEVEHAIQTHGDVLQAVVVARAAGEGRRSRALVAYVVAGEFGCSEQELAQYLAGTLPPYMLPAAYVFLDALPLTAHGKVDRAALPEPEQLRQKTYVAPRTDLERAVCEVWSEVLGHGAEPLGTTDDFFKLGGDSIVAIQMLSRVRQRFGVHLLVNEVLDQPTVAALCALLTRRLSEGAGAPDGGAVSEAAVPMGEAPLLPVQRWFFDQEFTRPDHWNQAFLIATPPLDQERLRRAVRELGDRHGAFRLRYRYGTDEEAGQYYTDDFRPTDLAVAAADGTEDLRELFTAWQSDFDLRRGPVYRVGYVDGLPDGSARVFVACHHLIVDAVGWRILTEELEALYHGRALLPAGSGYGQWGEALQRYADGHPDERDHWQRTVEGFARTGDAALRGLVLSEDTHTVSGLTLDRDTSRRLLRESHHTYRTQINDLLLAAFAQALRDLTGETDHYILLEGHGREEIGPRLDVSRTLGWFTTMFPVRLSAGPDRLAGLRATKETLRAIPAKGIGYGALYGYDAGRLPRINFNYLGRLDHDEAPGPEARWRLTREDAGIAVDPANRDGNIMTVNGWVVDGRLTFTLANKLGQETGDRFARRFEESLTALVDELSRVERTYLTPSDVDRVVRPEYLDELQADREIDSVHLANSLQQGFIYHALTQGGTDDAYIVQMMWSYATAIEPRLLREAWLAAQRKYPSLRLRFGWQDDLVQIVDAHGTPDWRYHDLSHEPPERRAEALRAIREEDRAEPYDLGRGPLFRIHLVRLGDGHHTCLFSHHHSILDGWSITVLLDFVHDTYQALLAGLPVDSAPDRGYGAAQRYLQDHHRDEDGYWREYLAGYEDRMDLRGLLRPAARAGGVRTEEIRRVEDMREAAVTISGEPLARVRRLTQQAGVTSNALFLSLWHKALACYSGSRQTITGVVVSGRNIPTDDIDRTVGLLINTLPLVLTSGAPDELVVDTLRDVQRRINTLNARSTVNLSALHEGANRLFDSLFIYENWPRISPDGWQKAFSVRDAEEFEKLDYPLSMIVSETPDSIRLRLAYAAELFDPHLAEELLRMQRHLLDGVLAGAQRPWSAIQLLTEEERARVTGILNPQPPQPATAGTFLDRFEAQAERRPEHTAVSCEGAALTYRALDERANRLAHLLAGADGLDPEEPVVVCMGKGIDLMVAILAVAKARGAYVLLDPSYLDERIAYILTDTKAATVLTTHRDAARLAGLGEPRRSPAVLALDTPETAAALAAAPPVSPGPRPAADELMYVLYTSGTTGDPKGVMVEHGSFDLLVSQVSERYFPDRESVSTYSLTNHVFDIFGLEYGLPLSTGGTVELAIGIPDTLDCGPYDFVQATPTVCDVLLDRLTGTDGTLLLVGGEKLDQELLDRVTAASLDLVHVYGPTETTIWSTSWRYRHTEPRDGLPVNLGRPFGNETAHVLDAFHRTLPVGAVGELHIGGGGLARGYLHRDDLTAERFVTLPPAVTGGTAPVRLYRTGDLVRLLPGGVLEFIGRNDAQVKLHGHRIELGEIEAALLRHPAVRQAVVVVKDIGRPLLMGYYVSDSALDADELTGFLRRNLSTHMVPAACVRLAALPRTISGKVDRAALPDPEFAPTPETTPSRSRLEADLCAAVAGLLGLRTEEVGIDDDFFRLGGNSVLSVKLVSLVRRELGLAVTVAHLLETRTVRAFTEGLDIRRAHPAEITPTVFDRPEDQLLSFAQERLWFIEKFERGTHAYNVPLVLGVADHVDSGILLAGVRAVVERHEILRTLIKETRNGVGYQVVRERDEAPPPVVRVPDAEALREHLRRDVERVFDLANEGPLHMRLYEVERPAARYLAFVIHHIAFDGWSTDVLLEDLTAAYALLEQAPPGTGPARRLPAPELSYRDFAAWQRRYLTGERADALARFWAEKLQGHARLELVPDRPRPDTIDYRGADLYLTVDAEVSHGLRRLAQQMRVSLFSLLLSAHHLALRCFSDQDDIVVGVPVANRDHPRLERLVGFFINTLPLRVRVDPAGTVADHIEATSREVMDLLLHQELPFEQLLTALDVPRDMSRHPVFQVTFSVQSFGAPSRGRRDGPREILRTTNLTRELYRIARFDLSTSVDDSCDELEINVNYATGLFDHATVESFGETYVQLLRQFAGLAGDTTAQRRLTIPDLTYRHDDDTAHAGHGRMRSVHVLDSDLRPLPVGAVGELCIGGAGPGPVDGSGNEPLYRTGNLVRWAPDGSLRSVGRRGVPAEAPPAPAAGPQLTGGGRFTAPRNGTEEKARAVMAGVLAMDPDRISVHDDFFGLGGNSLLSIKLISGLAAETGIDLGVAAVFRYRTVANLVEGLDTVAAGPVPIEPARPSDPSRQPLSFAQERLWFIDQYEQGSDVYNIHLSYALLPGVEVALLERCFRAVYERHEVLRTVIRRAPGGDLHQVVLDHRHVPMVVRHRTAAGEADLTAEARAEAGHHFDLAREAPIRITFYQRGVGAERRAFVGILVHHIAFDGWSADLLLAELDALHRHFTRPPTERDARPALPALTVQYRDFAAWERGRLSGDRLGKLLAYWRNRLEGRQPLELPTDRVRPRRADHRGGQLVVELGEETTTALRRLAREADAGLFSVLLAAYYLLLQAFTNRADLVVGIPAFNRTHHQTHDLIGCFVNSLALDFDIDREDDVRTMIGKVAARVIEAQEHQEMPFERLVGHLNLPADPSRHPLFQVWFDVNSFAEAEADRADSAGAAGQGLLRTHDLTGYAAEGQSPTGAKFDLGLVINDGGRALACVFSYATSLFEESTVDRFADTYRAILEQFAGATGGDR